MTEGFRSLPSICMVLGPVYLSDIIMNTLVLNGPSFTFKGPCVIDCTYKKHSRRAVCFV